MLYSLPDGCPRRGFRDRLALVNGGLGKLDQRTGRDPHTGSRWSISASSTTGS
jgi:hypothetical protein